MQDFRKNLYQTPIYIRIANQNQFKFESELFLRSHGDGIPTHLWNWQVMINLHFNLSLVYESLDFISGWLVINIVMNEMVETMFVEYFGTTCYF